MTAAPSTPRSIRHEAIFASAGTGKTEELAHRFIALLGLQCARGMAPDSILALTFTRNAAWEMLERIVSKLADAVLEPARRAELASRIGRALSDADAARLLDTLADNLHRLRISTIDSFMYGIVGCYAFETGLSRPPDLVEFHPVHDWDERAIARLFADEARQAAVASRLTDLFADLCGEEQQIRVTELLLGIVGKGRDLFRSTDAAAWSSVKPAVAPLTDQQIVDCLTEALTFAGQCDSRLRPVLGQWYAAPNPRDIMKSTLAQNMASAEPKYYRKPLPTAMVAVLKPMFIGIAARLIAIAASRTIAFRTFLDRFDAMLHAVRAEANVVGFDDIAAMLAGRLCADGPDAVALSDIYYRLDGAVAHLLIDEFQDTSWDQWRALKPIATEILQDTDGIRSYFMVGDRKQAIYGFRGGDARLFTAVTDHYGSGISQHALNQSHRFGQNIADTVNRVFSDPAAKEWRRGAGFDAHQGIAREPDYAELRRIALSPDDDDADIDSLADVTARLIEKVKPLERGLRPAVLCPTNKLVGDAVSALRARGIRAFEHGRSSVADEPAVAAVLALLEWADAPDNQVAAFHVRHSYLAPRLPKNQRAFLDEIRKRLVYEPYPAVIRWLVTPVLTFLSTREQEYVQKLGDVAALYAPTATVRPADFVAFVRSTAIMLPAPSDGVACMTIHAAKGLTFDMVILPVPDKEGSGDAGPGLLSSEAGPPDINHGPRINRVLVNPGTNVELFDDRVNAMIAARDTRADMDRFNRLYVAMTRARRALYILVSAKYDGKEDAVSVTTPKILLRSLGHTKDEAAVDALGIGGEICHAAGNATWFSSLKEAGKAGTTQPAAPPSVALGPVARRHRPVVTPSEHETPRSALFVREGFDAARRGTALHALYQHVTWLDDSTRLDDTRLCSIAQTAAPGLRTPDCIGIVRDFRASIAQPRIKRILTRPNEPCDVRTELPFAHILDDKLVTGVIDRVVFYPHAASPGRMVIVDYKSDEVTNETKRAQRTRIYQAQLDLYRRALAAAYGLAASSISTELVFIRV